MIGPAPWAGSGLSASSTTASGHARRNPPPPLEVPLATFLSTQHASLRGEFSSDCPEYAGQLGGGGARPQKEPRGAARSPALAKPPGCQATGPPAYKGVPQLPAHPRAAAGSATAQPEPPVESLRNPIAKHGAPKPQGDMPCMRAECGSRATATGSGTTPNGGPISSGTWNSRRSMPRRLG